MTAQDPHRTSHYVTDAYYAALIETFTDWQRDEALVHDHVERDRFAALLAREARLLDQHRYDAWLDMFEPECIYWAPGRPGETDPRTEIAVMFEDRRRLEDRVYRLRTGFAWSQAPVSRTVRHVTNVELFEGREPGHRMLRSNVLITEFWDSEIRTWAGWMGYQMVPHAGAWLIRAKQINLIDCDQCIRNPSIVL